MKALFFFITLIIATSSNVFAQSQSNRFVIKLGDQSNATKQLITIGTYEGKSMFIFSWVDFKIEGISSIEAIEIIDSSINIKIDQDSVISLKPGNKYSSVSDTNFGYILILACDISAAQLLKLTSHQVNSIQIILNKDKELTITSLTDINRQMIKQDAGLFLKEL
jgi:hypothetical protein